MSSGSALRSQIHPTKSVESGLKNKSKDWAKCLREMRLILRRDDDNDGGQRVGGTARNSWQPSPSLKISFHSLSFPRHDAMRGHTITVVLNHIDQIVYLSVKHSIWSLFRECFGLWKWLYSHFENAYMFVNSRAERERLKQTWLSVRPVVTPAPLVEST